MVERYTYTREMMIDDAMLLWRRYAIEYRTLLEEYKNYLMIKDALGIDLKRIGNKFLEEYPKIDYMDYNTERGARKYLGLLDSYLILEQLDKAKRFNEEPIVETLRDRNKYSVEQIRAHCEGQKENYKKSAIAVSPKSCGGGRHSHRSRLSFTGGLNVNEQ